MLTFFFEGFLSISISFLNFSMTLLILDIHLNLLFQFVRSQAIVDMYKNAQIKNICETFANKFNVSIANSTQCCTSGSCTLRYTDNYYDWEQPGLLRYIAFLLAQFAVTFTLLLLNEAGMLIKLRYIVRRQLARLSFNNKRASGDVDVIKSPHSSSSHAHTKTNGGGGGGLDDHSYAASDILRVDGGVLEDEENGDITKDSDVIAEEMRIDQIASNLALNSGVDPQQFGNDDNEIFVVNRLAKTYANFMAVRGVSFALRRTESFGLLGVNGAGKTSTFKMITGDELISSGDAYLNAVSIKRNLKLFQRQLGYCPQFDPLIDQMTVYESMVLFASLRGIRKELIRSTCLSLIGLLDLNDHVYKMCYTLSGGNKRKLSVAIALVGSPVVVLLDEPTS